MRLPGITTLAITIAAFGAFAAFDRKFKDSSKPAFK